MRGSIFRHGFFRFAGVVLFALVFTTASRAQSPRQVWLAPAHRMYPTGVNAGAAIVVHDFNGDGWDDAIIAGSNARLSFRLGTGTGTMLDVPGAIPASLFSAVGSIAAGDLDNDGDLDLLLGVADGGLQLYWNSGAGIFLFGAFLPGTGGSAMSLALGDIDGDGDLDAFMGNATTCGFSGCTNTNRLFRNDGARQFTEVTQQIPLQNGHTAAASFGDLDADGDLDLVLAQSNPQFGGNVAFNRIWKNDGTGQFSDHPTVVSAVPRYTTSMLLRDFDGDGDLDLWFGNRSDGTSARDEFYLNDGSANFVDATSRIPNDPFEIKALAAADVDRDSDLDIAWVDENGAYGLYLNDGTARFTPRTIFNPSVDRAQVAAFARMSLDGDNDLILGTSLALLSDGRGNFIEGSARLARIETPTNDVALADLNGDGQLDAYLARQGQDEVLLSIGASYFVGMGELLLPNNEVASTCVALGDVDRDGDIDAYVGKKGPGGNRAIDQLLLNDGTGRFTDATQQLPVGSLATHQALFFDADGDSDLDLFVGSTLSGSVATNWILINDGSGTFSLLNSAIPTIAGQTQDIAAGDVDGDGDLDLMLAQSSIFFAADNVLLLNQGPGRFQVAPSGALPQFAEFSTTVDLGDVDGDGDLDALIAGTMTSDLRRLYANDGSGIFSYTGQYLGQGFTPDAAMKDLDDDGDLDLVFASLQRSEIYENIGGGAVLPASPLALPVIGRQMAFGDVDADGDLDAFLVEDGALLCTNLTRQVRWREIPRLGKALFIDLNSTPLSSALLMFGTERASIALPTMGTLQLHPARLLSSFALGFNAQGETTWGLQLPLDPTLLGGIVHAQALFFSSPWKLSNLEHLIVTRF